MSKSMKGELFTLLEELLPTDRGSRARLNRLVEVIGAYAVEAVEAAHAKPVAAPTPVARGDAYRFSMKVPVHLVARYHHLVKRGRGMVPSTSCGRSIEGAVLDDGSAEARSRAPCPECFPGRAECSHQGPWLIALAVYDEDAKNWTCKKCSHRGRGPLPKAPPGALPEVHDPATCHLCIEIAAGRRVPDTQLCVVVRKGEAVPCGRPVPAIHGNACPECWARINTKETP